MLQWLSGGDIFMCQNIYCTPVLMFFCYMHTHANTHTHQTDHTIRRRNQEVKISLSKETIIPPPHLEVSLMSCEWIKADEFASDDICLM